MSSIKVVLYKSKTLKSGEHPLLLRVTANRKIKYISIGASCMENQWDQINNLPKKKHPLYTELCVLIDKKRLEANKLLLNFESEGSDFTAEEIKGKLKANALPRKYVLEYFDEIILRLKKTNRYGYANIFNSTKNSIITFRGNRDFDFNQISNQFLIKYEETFLSRDVSLNSIFVFMRTFKTLINYARKEGLIKKELDPFKEFSFTKYRRTKTKKRALTKEQMQKIRDLDLSQETRLYDSRNFFLFSFFCRGINFIDMATIKWTDIQNNRLEYIRSKTKERFNMELLSPALEIIEYYRPLTYNSRLNYIFPILNEKHSTPKSVDYRIDKMLKIVNKDLKTIAGLADINEKITTYVARHSYATILKRSGVATAIISEALGHDSEKTTQIYLDNFENKVIDNASKHIL